ncbi:S6 family peptidase [Escherichia coli]
MRETHFIKLVREHWWWLSSGENPGTLNTGDGTVILAQKADAAGRVRAFSEVRIVSGRLDCGAAGQSSD